VHAQTVAQLSGTVVDDSGGALWRGTVTQSDTGMTRFVITSTEADTFANPLIGP
jgi:hypothetical protein